MLPSQWREVWNHFLGHGIAGVSHGLDGFLQIDRVPQADGCDRQIQTTGLPLLLFAVAIADRTTPVESQCSSQLIAQFSLVQTHVGTTAQFGLLREQGTFNSPQLAESQRDFAVVGVCGQFTD